MDLRGDSIIRRIGVLLAALLAGGLVCALQLPNPFPQDGSLVITTLDNGVRLVVREDHSLPIVAAVVVVRGGSAAEARSHGRAHYLEHLVFQGTRLYPEPLGPQLALERVGGISNAVTSRDATQYQATVASAHSGLLLRVLADITLHPLLGEERFTRERAIILAEIQQERDDPVASVMSHAYAFTYGTHPYRASPKGSIEEVLRLTHAEVTAYHRAWYAPNNISVVLVGDITADRAYALARETFGKARPAALPTRAPVDATMPATVRRDFPGGFADTYQALVFPAPGIADFPAVAATDVALALLIEGNDALLPARWARDGVEVKRFGGEYITMRDPGRIIIWAQTAPEMAEKLRASTEACLRELAAGAVPETPLRLATQRLAAQFLRDQETYSQQAATLAFYEALGDARLASHYLPTLETVTAGRVQRAVPRGLLGWFTLSPRPGRAP